MPGGKQVRRKRLGIALIAKSMSDTTAGEVRRAGESMRVEPGFSRSDTQQYIDLDSRSHHIVLGNADRMTAFSGAAYAEIRDGVIYASLDERVDTIILRSEAEAFGVGGDLKRLDSLLGGDRADAVVRADREFARDPYRPLLRSPKTVISLVDGLCIGGGLLLALASDVVIATQRARFAVGEARVGVFDPVMPELLPLVVGLSRARYMALTASVIDAECAERWGIVTVLVSDAVSAQGELDSILDRIRRTSPTARALYKRTMTRHVPDTAGFENLNVAVSGNGREGRTAFIEKRLPEWESLNVEPLG